MSKATNSLKRNQMSIPITSPSGKPIAVGESSPTGKYRRKSTANHKNMVATPMAIPRRAEQATDKVRAGMISYYYSRTYSSTAGESNATNLKRMESYKSV